MAPALGLQPFEPFTKLNFLNKKVAIIKQLLDSAFAQCKDLCLHEGANGGTQLSVNY